MASELTQKRRHLGVAASLLVASTGCASLDQQTTSDPLEPLNRPIFAFNDGVDTLLVRPVTATYTFVAPDPVEEGVSNFFDNLFTPNTIVNQFLQGKPGEGINALARMAVNTTLGIGGVFDVASGMGLERDREDFGQTFAVWGVESGPYLVLPLIGSSTFRDGIGRVAAYPTNQINWLEDDEARLALHATAILDASAQFLDARDLIGGDRYLFVRDAYLQRRKFEAMDGAVDEPDPFLDE